jgi:hypothetical protein
MVKTLDRLEREIREQQEIRRQEEEQQAPRQRRWEETLTRFGEFLPEDLSDRVDEALRDDRCPLWRWLEDQFRGRSRLPECLTEEVMRRLVLIRLEEADRCVLSVRMPALWAPVPAPQVAALEARETGPTARRTSGHCGTTCPVSSSTTAARPARSHKAGDMNWPT